jgi:RNA polymerase sigma-70 factor (ECF subfamily)
MSFSQFAADSGESGIALTSTLGLGAAGERPRLSERDRIVELFREVRTPLFSYLVYLGLNPSEADDMVQESFLRLHRQLQSGSKIEEPRAWVFRVAHNLALNFHRDHRRLIPESELTADREARSQRPYDPEQNPENIYLRKEALMRLDAGLAHLTDQQRQCVHLRAQGLRYREIAAVLGISVSSAAELLQRAIVRLASEIHG